MVPLWEWNKGHRLQWSSCKPGWWTTTGQDITQHYWLWWMGNKLQRHWGWAYVTTMDNLTWGLNNLYAYECASNFREKMTQVKKAVGFSSLYSHSHYCVVLAQKKPRLHTVLLSVLTSSLVTAGANGGPYNLLYVCSGQTRRPPEAATPEATEIHKSQKVCHLNMWPTKTISSPIKTQ